MRDVQPQGHHIRHEPMRIAGRKVDADDVIELRCPYADALIGTVPAGGVAHAKEASAIAAKYKPKLSRYDRQQVLLRTAELLVQRRDELSDLITLELGNSKKDSRYEVGRAYDLFSLGGQLCIRNDGEIFSCDLPPQDRARKISRSGNR